MHRLIKRKRNYILEIDYLQCFVLSRLSFSKLKINHLCYIFHGAEESERSRDTLRFQKNNRSRKFCRLIHKQVWSKVGKILRIFLFVREYTIYGFAKIVEVFFKFEYKEDFV